MPVRHRHPTQRGFTLVEMLVVIVVLALLCALVLSVLTSIRQQARRKDCAFNLSNIGKYCHLYADAAPNLGMFPTYGADPRKNGLKSLNLLYNGYLSDYWYFACPAANANRHMSQMANKIAKVALPDQTTANMDPSHSAYGYSPGHKPAHARVGIAADMADDPARNSPNHGADRPGQNVVTAAGSVMWLDSTNLPQESNDTPSDRLFLDDGLPPDQETFIIQ